MTFCAQYRRQRAACVFEHSHFVSRAVLRSLLSLAHFNTMLYIYVMCVHGMETLKGFINGNRKSAANATAASNFQREQLKFLRPQVELANNELYILFSAVPKHTVES
jgi:hypothetical protein